MNTSRTSTVFSRFAPLAIIIAVATVALAGCGGLNGTYIEPPQGQRGLCSLYITNGYKKDIVVKLADVKDPSVCLHYVYVSAGKTALISGIAPGNLTLKYSMGSEWDPVKKTFAKDRANFETDQIFKFEESVREVKTEDGISKETHWSVNSFMLNTGDGEGNMTTSQIDDKEFQGK